MDHHHRRRCMDAHTHRMICTLAYFTLILYIAEAEGNPFLNFFVQSAIEAPAFFLATWSGKMQFNMYVCLWMCGVSLAIDTTNNN